jgi:hypothetical protein
MMQPMLWGGVADAPMTLGARGRGLGRLFQGLIDGDPVAWTITGVIVAVLVVIVAVKVAKARRGV